MRTDEFWGWGFLFLFLFVLCAAGNNPVGLLVCVLSLGWLFYYHVKCHST